jgi:predicted  nucleic acid-binding Zn-ribbon protein
MSRWLSSVNNLLENLDGQAETVAETVAEQATTSGISSNLRRFNNTLASNASALTSNIAHARSNNYDDNVGSFDEEEEYYDDDDSAFFDDDEFGDDGDFSTDDDEGAIADDNGDTVVEETNEIATELAIPPLESISATPESSEPTNNQPQTNRVQDEVTAVATNEEFPNMEESPSTSSSANVVVEEQIISLQKTPQQQSPKESTGENIAVEAEDDKQDVPSEAGVSSSANDGAIDSSGNLPVSLQPQKPSNGHTVDSSKLNKAAPKPPPPAQKVSAKPTTVAPASVPNTNGTKQKQMLQQDEIKLIKKQQQQHQQVLTSKNKTIQSLESQLVKLREELTKGAAEQEKLNQRTRDLDEKLKASEREVEAQTKELLQAGGEMEKIRADAKEEREDLLDDHEDEMEDAQKKHQEALDKMREEYERTIADWKQRYESEESLRQQEGGDSIRELQDANKRERDALKKLAEVTDERTGLQAKLDHFVGQETTLKQQVESSLESAETVAAREQRARDELDEAAATHAKQMTQRQRREAELEQTILEMGSALTLAKQQLQQAQNASSTEGEKSGDTSDSNQHHINGSYYKEQFDQVAEELETTRVRFTMETQRREALQHELNEVSKEREQELSLTQSRQHEHDRKVSDLESTIHRLQASIRASQQQPSQSNENDESFYSAYESDTPQKVRPNEELEAAKQEISNLSEQLFRQQALAKNAKTEILALKGRLQAANTRADNAEKAQYNPKQPRSRAAYDIEGGGPNSPAPSFSVRRRVKGGSSRGVRSIRSALPCFGSGRASAEGGAFLEQVALTIDAIDSWMVDTGSFMRHEPFARLGLLAYLMILHLYAFALVVFHTTEVPHGDFGSMDSNPRHWREHT